MTDDEMTDCEMTDYYDKSDTVAAAAREQALFERLPGHLAQAQIRCPGVAAQLAGFDTSDLRSRQALAAVPVVAVPPLYTRLLSMNNKTNTQPQPLLLSRGYTHAYSV